MLGDLGNNLVNENIDLFINDIGPILERSLGKIWKSGILKKILNFNHPHFSSSQPISEVGKSNLQQSTTQRIPPVKMLSCNLNFVKFMYVNKAIKT